MATSHSKSKDSNQAFALILLLGGALALVWWLLGTDRRAELLFIYWTHNSGALVATITAWVLVGLALVLLLRKRSRFLTEELRHNLEISKKKKGKQRWLLWVPYLSVGGTAAIGYLIFYFFVGDPRWFFFDYLATEPYRSMRLFLVLSSGFLPYPLIFLYTYFFLNGSGIAQRWRLHIMSLPERDTLVQKTLPYPGDYQSGKSRPVFLLGARESSKSLKLEPDSKIPSWVLFSYPLIFGGLIIFGKKGSGKTALMKRIAEDAIRFQADNPDLKCALCFIDIKGDLADFIEKKSKEYGREADIVRLGVDTVAKWNPFATLGPTSRATDCRQIGFFLRCAMTAGQTSVGSDSYWHDNADNLLFRASHLLALAGQTVSFDSLYTLITQLNEDSEHRDMLFEIARTNALDVGEHTPQMIELMDTERYFEKEFVVLDKKIKTTVVNLASNFLQKFLAVEYKQSFCCPASTPGHFGGFRDLIATGKIFVLDVRSNEHGTIANALGTLVKLNYQAAVKTRDRFSADNMRRATVFGMDEAQSFITPSSQNTEGDDKYLEMSRSFRAVDVYATQQYSSFKAAVGSDMTQRIIGSFNNIISYKHNDPEITAYLQKIIGNEDREERSFNVSESSSRVAPDVLSMHGSTEEDHQISRTVSVQNREKPLIDAALFKSFTDFEALGVFDTPGGMQVTRFFTKPYFVDARTPHADVLKLIAANAEG